MVKNLPASQKAWIRSLGQEYLLEKGMATHSSILAWRIPWTEEPGRLWSVGLQRVGHEWEFFTFRDRDQHMYFLSFYSDEFFFWIFYQRNKKNFDFFFFLVKEIFVYLLFAVLGLHCFVQAFCSCERGPLLRCSGFLLWWLLELQGMTLGTQ